MTKNIFLIKEESDQIHLKTLKADINTKKEGHQEAEVTQNLGL